MKCPLPTLYLRFSAGVLTPDRVPLLERLLARADATAAIADWRGDAYSLIAADAGPIPAPGAAALFGALEPVEGVSAYLAAPVHYAATMTGVRLAPDGILRLDAAQASTLAQDFNRVFGGGEQRLVATRIGALVCVFGSKVSAETHDPRDAAGADIGAFQATGDDAHRLRRLISEIEMWLFEHAVNRARAAAGLPAISGLWLWGGGAVLARPPRLTGWAAGDDVVFGPWLAGEQRAPGGSPRAPNSGVVALEAVPGTAEWGEAEERWLIPAIADLRAGRLQSIVLSAAHRCYTIEAGFKWRVWRRARPWWEYFG